MSNVVVVGTQWGDEGKGKIVDILTQQADVIARFQGGANAGHTVVVGEKQTILHQIPSGILHAGKQCVIGNGVVLDIETLIDEIDEIRQQGYFSDDAALLISDKAHLIMPYHKRIDIAREQKKGKNKIGTTGRGIGPAYEDKVGRHGLRLVDLMNETAFRQKLADIMAEKNFYLEHYLDGDTLSVDEVYDTMMRCHDRLAPLAGNASSYLNQCIRERRRILFEGAQGTMLDIDHGTYPFVTSSNTLSAQASIGSGVGPKHLHHIVGITKAYTTRVGAGPFPTELTDDTGEFLRTEGGEFGATTGRPRRCGWFDLVPVCHSRDVNSITHLIVTKLDVLSGLDTIRVCTGYRYGDEILTTFPTDFAVLEQCQPVYDELPGWKQDLGEVTSISDLPANARDYIRYIEEKTAIPVSMVSVGTRRRQIITVDDPFGD